MTRRTKPPGAYEGRESAFQASAIKLVRAIAGPSALAFHVPNGRNAGSARMGGFWKGQGVVSGVPDIMVFHATGGDPDGYDGVEMDNIYGLAIELKVWPGKPSDEQLNIHDMLRAAGWHVEVCYGLGEVENVTNDYFGK